MKALSQKVQDTIVFVTDSIEAHPFIKGALPAAAGVGISFLDQLEQWLRLGSLIVGFCIGALALYLKVRKVIKEHKDD